MMNIHKIKGLAAIELMIVVGVISILLAVGLPGLQDTIARMETNSQAKSLVASLNFARSEAIKRGRLVSVCGSASSTDCAADAWSDGWIVFVDANEDADGATGSVDAGDEVLRVHQGLRNGTLEFTADLQQYDAQGFGTNAAAATFLLCPEDDNSLNAQSVEISMTGRGRRIHEGLDCS